MVLGENVNPDKFARMNVILQANGYEPIVEKAVYSFKSKDSDLFTYFSKDENFRFVQDLGDDPGASPPRSGEGKNLFYPLLTVTLCDDYLRIPPLQNYSCRFGI